MRHEYVILLIYWVCFRSMRALNVLLSSAKYYCDIIAMKVMAMICLVHSRSKICVLCIFISIFFVSNARCQELVKETFAGGMYDNSFAWTENEDSGFAELVDPVGPVIEDVEIVPDGFALQLNNIDEGSCNAVFDIGRTFKSGRIYVEMLVNVMSEGQSPDAYENIVTLSGYHGVALEIAVRTNSGIGHKFFVRQGYKQIGFNGLGYGQWFRIGLELDLDAGQYTPYFNGVAFEGDSLAANNFNMLEFGSGHKPNGWKVQYANIVISDNEFVSFDDNPETHLGYGLHRFFDSINGNDDWPGFQPQPYDPEGGDNYIDGPKASIASGSERNFENSSWWFKRDSVFRESLFAFYSTKYGDGAFFRPYGAGDRPVISGGKVETGWTKVAAGAGNTYRTGTGSGVGYGVWVDEVQILEKSLSGPFALDPGQYYTNGYGSLWVRLDDDGDPAEHSMISYIKAIGSKVSTFEIEHVENVVLEGLEFRHARDVVFAKSDSFVMQDCLIQAGSRHGLWLTGDDAYIRGNGFSRIWNGESYPSESIALENSRAKRSVIVGNSFYDNFRHALFSGDCGDSLFAFNIGLPADVNGFDVSSSSTASGDSFILLNTMLHEPNGAWGTNGHGYGAQGGGGNTSFAGNICVMNGDFGNTYNYKPCLGDDAGSDMYADGNLSYDYSQTNQRLWGHGSDDCVMLDPHTWPRESIALDDWRERLEIALYQGASANDQVMDPDFVAIDWSDLQNADLRLKEAISATQARSLLEAGGWANVYSFDGVRVTDGDGELLVADLVLGAFQKAYYKPPEIEPMIFNEPFELSLGEGLYVPITCIGAEVITIDEASISKGMYVMDGGIYCDDPSCGDHEVMVTACNGPACVSALYVFTVIVNQPHPVPLGDTGLIFAVLALLGVFEIRRRSKLASRMGTNDHMC